MNDFVAIDVETANYQASSICSIGCVKVRNGMIVDTFYSLVHPEPDWYASRCTAIHGLSKLDTRNAPPFDQVMKQVYIFAEGLPFVAHNASFDYRCICEASRIYQMDEPEPFLCTLNAARKKFSHAECPSKSLPCVCERLGINFANHHNALADAEACAQIAIQIL